MRVNVHETWRNEETMGIDLLVGTTTDVTDFDDPTALDLYVGLPRFGAGAIDHGTAADNKPALAHLVLHSLGQKLMPIRGVFNQIFRELLAFIHMRARAWLGCKRIA